MSCCSASTPYLHSSDIIIGDNSLSSHVKEYEDTKHAPMFQNITDNSDSNDSSDRSDIIQEQTCLQDFAIVCISNMHYLGLLLEIVFSTMIKPMRFH